MEIISIPLKGKLKHGDSQKNSRSITPGDIQTMSAGTGIYHSEMNGSDTGTGRVPTNLGNAGEAEYTTCLSGL